MPLPEEQLTTQTPIGGDTDENLTEEEKKKRKEEEELRMQNILEMASQTPRAEEDLSQDGEVIPEGVDFTPTSPENILDAEKQRILEEGAVTTEDEPITDESEETAEVESTTEPAVTTPVKDSVNPVVDGKNRVPENKVESKPINEEEAVDLYNMALSHPKVDMKLNLQQFKEKWAGDDDKVKKLFKFVTGGDDSDESNQMYAAFLGRLRKVPTSEEDVVTDENKPDHIVDAENSNPSQLEINANNWGTTSVFVKKVSDEQDADKRVELLSGLLKGKTINRQISEQELADKKAAIAAEKEEKLSKIPVKGEEEEEDKIPVMGSDLGVNKWVTERIEFKKAFEVQQESEEHLDEVLKHLIGNDELGAEKREYYKDYKIWKSIHDEIIESETSKWTRKRSMEAANEIINEQSEKSLSASELIGIDKRRTIQGIVNDDDEQLFSELSKLDLAIQEHDDDIGYRKRWGEEGFNTKLDLLKKRKLDILDEFYPKINEKIAEFRAEKLRKGITPEELASLEKSIAQLKARKAILIQDNPQEALDGVSTSFDSNNLGIMQDVMKIVSESNPDASNKERFDLWFMAYKAQVLRTLDEVGWVEETEDESGNTIQELDVPFAKLRNKDLFGWTSIMGMDLPEGKMHIRRSQKDALSQLKSLNALLPVYLANTAGVDESGFVDGFISGFDGFLTPTVSAETPITETQKAQELTNVLTDSGLANLNKEAIKELNAAATPKEMFNDKFHVWNPLTWGETDATRFGETVGMLSGVMIEFVPAAIVTRGMGTSFSAAKTMATIQKVDKLRRIAAPVVRYHKHLKSAPGLAKWLSRVDKFKALRGGKVYKRAKDAFDAGVQFEVAGEIFETNEEEFNFLSGAAGQLLGGIAASAINKTGAGLSRWMKLEFGTNTVNIMKNMNEVFSRGVGETGEEITQELYQAWVATPQGASFTDELKERFPTASSREEFLITTFAMGMGFGSVAAFTRSYDSWKAKNGGKSSPIVDAAVKEITGDMGISASKTMMEESKVKTSKPVERDFQSGEEVSQAMSGQLENKSLTSEELSSTIEMDEDIDTKDTQVAEEVNKTLGEEKVSRLAELKEEKAKADTESVVEIEGEIEEIIREKQDVRDAIFGKDGKTTFKTLGKKSAIKEGDVIRVRNKEGKAVSYNVEETLPGNKVKLNVEGESVIMGKKELDFLKTNESFTITRKTTQTAKTESAGIDSLNELAEGIKEGKKSKEIAEAKEKAESFLDENVKVDKKQLSAIKSALGMVKNRAASIKTLFASAIKSGKDVDTFMKAVDSVTEAKETTTTKETKPSSDLSNDLKEVKPTSTLNKKGDVLTVEKDGVAVVYDNIKYIAPKGKKSGRYEVDVNGVKTNMSIAEFKKLKKDPTARAFTKKEAKAKVETKAEEVVIEKTEAQIKEIDSKKEALEEANKKVDEAKAEVDALTEEAKVLFKETGNAKTLDSKLNPLKEKLKAAEKVSKKIKGELDKLTEVKTSKAKKAAPKKSKKLTAAQKKAVKQKRTIEAEAKKIQAQIKEEAAKENKKSQEETPTAKISSEQETKINELVAKLPKDGKILGRKSSIIKDVIKGINALAKGEVIKVTLGRGKMNFINYSVDSKGNLTWDNKSGLWGLLFAADKINAKGQPVFEGRTKEELLLQKELTIALVKAKKSGEARVAEKAKRESLASLKMKEGAKRVAEAVADINANPNAIFMGHPAMVKAVRGLADMGIGATLWGVDKVVGFPLKVGIKALQWTTNQIADVLTWLVEKVFKLADLTTYAIGKVIMKVAGGIIKKSLDVGYDMKQYVKKILKQQNRSNLNITQEAEYKLVIDGANKFKGDPAATSKYFREQAIIARVLAENVNENKVYNEVLSKTLFDLSRDSAVKTEAQVLEMIETESNPNFVGHFDIMFGESEKLAVNNETAKTLKGAVKDLLYKRRGEIGKGKLIDDELAHRMQRDLSWEQLVALTFVMQKTKEYPESLRNVKNWERGEINRMIKNPTPKMLEYQGEIRKKLDGYHDSMFENDKGTRENYVKDYVPQLWDMGGNELSSDQMKRLATENPHTKQRFIDNYAAGIELGLTPKTLNIAEIFQVYSKNYHETAANRQFVESLYQLHTESGSRLAVLEDEPTPNGYVSINDPAFAKWVMRKNADGEWALTTAKLKVHPSVSGYVNAIMKGGLVSSIKDPGWRKIAGRVWGLQQLVKKVNLSVSLFHHWALSETSFATPAGMTSALGMWNPRKIYNEFITGKDPLKIFQDLGLSADAIEDGMVIEASPDIARQISEDFFKKIEGATDQMVIDMFDNVIGKKLSALTPVKKDKAGNTVRVGMNPVKGVADFVKKWDGFLWDYMHNGYKLMAYETMKSDFMMKNPTATDAQKKEAGRAIAKQVNNTFGGQAWELMGVSKSTQQMMQVALLSPDWTVSTFKQFMSPFAGFTSSKTFQAIKRNGRSDKRSGISTMDKIYNTAEQLDVANEFNDSTHMRKMGIKFILNAVLRNYAMMNVANFALTAMFGDTVEEDDSDDWNFMNNLLKSQEVSEEIKDFINKLKKEKIIKDKSYIDDLLNKANLPENYWRGKFLWQNDRGKKFALYAGRSPGTNDKMYFRMFKQFLEVPEFMEDPVGRLISKTSPLMRFLSATIDPATKFNVDRTRKEAYWDIAIPFSSKFFNPNEHLVPATRYASIMFNVSKGWNDGRAKNAIVEALESDASAEEFIEIAMATKNSDMTTPFVSVFFDALSTYSSKKKRDFVYEEGFSGKNLETQMNAVMRAWLSDPDMRDEMLEERLKDLDKMARILSFYDQEVNDLGQEITDWQMGLGIIPESTYYKERQKPNSQATIDREHKERVEFNRKHSWGIIKKTLNPKTEVQKK